MRDNEQFSLQQKIHLPFPLNKQQTSYIQSLKQSYLSQNKSHIFTPLSDRTIIVTLIYLLSQLYDSPQPVQMVFLTETISRKQVILSFAKHIQKKYFIDQIVWRPLRLETNQIKISDDADLLYKNERLLLVTTVSDYSQKKLFNDSTNTVTFMFVETTGITHTLGLIIENYITDTYIRRGYIEACKIQQQYKLGQKNKKAMMSEDAIQLISLISKESEYQEETGINENKGIFKTYEEKKNELKNPNKGNAGEGKKYEKNQLILLSLFIYILGYLQNLLNPNSPSIAKKQKSLRQFIVDFQNKTLLSSDLLEELPKYLKRIIKNYPGDCPYKLEEMYLYEIWQFLKRIQIIKNLNPGLQDKGIFLYFEKMNIEKNDFIIEESVNSMKLCIHDPKKVLPILQSKTRSITFVQNMSSSQAFISACFENKLVYRNLKYRLQNLYGVHISKTPSNEDIDFSKVSKNVAQNVKMKACGVLLYELSQFVPDGMIVYFYSPEGLYSFLKILKEKDEKQKILNRLNSTKKIFIQSQFEAENIKNIEQYKKCCNIGRGALYLLSASSNMAKNHQFFNHYSNCIVFIGLPKEPQRGDDIIKRSDTKISMMVRCLNNCINNFSEAKGVVFVGRQLNNGLDKWVPFVHIWEETTRFPLPYLRNHFINSQKISKKWQLQ